MLRGYLYVSSETEIFTFYNLLNYFIFVVPCIVILG